MKDVDAIFAASDLSSYNKRISELETNVANMGKAYNSQISSMESYTSTNENQIGDLERRLEGAESKIDQLQFALTNSQSDKPVSIPVK